MADKTIIYYSSNYEKEIFEKNVLKELVLKSCNLPIISITQKPIDIGQNICVGNVGRSGVNILRQIQLGIKKATTKYVCMAESDFLYPEEYFQFTPITDGAIYFINPIYIVWTGRHANHSYFLKNKSEGSMVCNRLYLISIIDSILKNFDMWYSDPDLGKCKIYSQIANCKIVSINTPIITFKTSENMHSKSPFSRKDRCRNLPYWGNSINLIERMFK